MRFKYFVARTDLQGGRASQFIASPPTFRQAAAQ
jgi:hypothetical protein